MALCLALSLLPTAAFADEGGGLDGPQMDIQQTPSDDTPDGNPSASNEDTGDGTGDNSQPQPNQGVTTPAALKNAIDAAVDGVETTVTLGVDIVLDTALSIPAGKMIVLDLDGKTLSISTTEDVIDNSGTLTVKNGTVAAKDDGKDTAGVAIDNLTGAVLTVEEDAGCETKLIGRSAIKNSGTSVVNGGVVESYNRNAIWGTAGSELTVNGGTVTSKTGSSGYGRAISSEGDVTIHGGTFYAGGSSGAGDNYMNAIGMFNGAVLTIATAEGETVTVTSETDYAVSTMGDAKIYIYGGSYSCEGDRTDVYDFEENGNIKIYGGTFKHEPYQEYLAEDHVAVAEEDGSFSVKEVESTALTVNSYEELADALAGTRLEPKDITLGTSVEIPAGADLRLQQGYTLTVPAGVTLTVSGILRLEDELLNQGTLDTSVGFIEYPLKVSSTGTIVGYPQVEDGVCTISTPMELQWLSCLVEWDNDNIPASIVLDADIALPDGVRFTPIGNTNFYYGATFDGGNHTISNIQVEVTSEYQGALFGNVGDVVIKNLTVSGKNTNSTSSYIGALAGYMSGSCTVQNVHVKDYTVASPISYGVGGFVGQIYSSNADDRFEFINCSTENVSVTGYANVGGIWGTSTGSKGTIGIYNCALDGTVNTINVNGAVCGGFGNSAPVEIIGLEHSELTVTVNNTTVDTLVSAHSASQEDTYAGSEYTAVLTESGWAAIKGSAAVTLDGIPCESFAAAAANAEDGSVIAVTGAVSVDTAVTIDKDVTVTGFAKVTLGAGGSLSISAGTYDAAPADNCLATGYGVRNNGNGTFTVVPKEDGELVVTPSADSSGNVTAALDGIYKNAETEIDNTGNVTEENSDNSSAGVTVNLTTSDGTAADKAALTVSAEAAASMAQNGAPALVVQTNVGTVKLDRTALNKIGSAAADSGSDIVITITENAAEVTDKIAASYTVEVKTDGATVSLLPDGQANGSITITLPTPANIDTEGLQAWYVTGSGADKLYVEQLDITDRVDGITFCIGHLSTIELTNGDPEGNTAVAAVTDTDGTVIGNYASLQAAITAASKSGTVTLLKDWTCDKEITIGKNQNVVLDLGGNTLTVEKTVPVVDYEITGSNVNSFPAHIVNNGESLVIKNGTIVGCSAAAVIANRSGTLEIKSDATIQSTSETYNNSAIIENLGGTVETSGQLISTANCGIRTYGGTVNMTGGSIEARYFDADQRDGGSGLTIFNRGYNNESAGAKVTISGGTIDAAVFAISTNNLYSGGGNPSNLTITGGTVTAVESSTIYWPSAGTLTIGTKGSTSGPTINSPKGSSVEICSGTLNVYGGTLNGGTEMTSDDSYATDQSLVNGYRKNSGSAGTGDAVTVISRRGSGYDTAQLNVNIEGGTFTSPQNYGVRYMDCNLAESETKIEQTVDVKITGGSFDGGIAAVDAEFVKEDDKDFISGGNYSDPVTNYLAADLTAQLYSASNPETPYSYYQNMEAAQKAAGPNDVITVLTPDGDGDPITYYTITLNNGDAVYNTYYIKSGDSFTLPAAPSGASNQRFDGWSLYGTLYQPGRTFTITESMTFDAEWTEVSSSSSGGSSDPSYSPKLDVSDGGSVKINPRTPEEGDEVTITVDPDTGYEVGDVTVTDRNGRDVRVTAGRNGTYTFEQPRGRVTISVTFVREGATAFFADVPETYWAYDEIAWAYENGYVNGTSATTFAPGASISRQQVWMILARLSGADPANMVEARQWAIDSGISDGTNPGNAVTRQQLAALLYRFAQMNGQGFTGAWAFQLDYPDADQISEYAYEAMCWMTMNGVIAGTSQGTLNPTGTATRAQFAVMLYRFWNQIG